jgi:acyl-CoA dehydrogenase
VDLSPSPEAEELCRVLTQFMDSHVYPAEETYFRQLDAAGPRDHPVAPIVEELKAAARERGLWNLFLPAISGLSNLDYAYLAAISGRSPYLAPEAMNCAAPDTGNMELLHMFGTPGQKQRWLEPLLAGTMRSGFSMTEPDVASSDARNIATRIVADGDHYVVNGRKWWTTGAADPRCRLFIVMGKTDPDAPPHHQQSMILIPRGTPGVEIVRALPVFGYHDPRGHCEVTFTDVRVPAANLLGEPGGGFGMAQARLGPGRIHHAMRAVGMAEHALELMCRRALDRHAFGGRIADQGVVQAQIAESRMEIEQLRLMVLKTAWLVDTVGGVRAASEVATIKVLAPRVAQAVLDRAIQVHGGAGVSADLPLARMWTTARVLRIADGPDEVHVRTIARRELARYQD